MTSSGGIDVFRIFIISLLWNKLQKINYSKHSGTPLMRLPLHHKIGVVLKPTKRFPRAKKKCL